MEDATCVCSQKRRASSWLPPSAMKPQDQISKDEKPRRTQEKPTDCQSSVARHLFEKDACTLTYNDSSFRVVCVCFSKSHLDVMEALYIRSLEPNLCARKSSITTVPFKFFVPLSTLLHPITIYLSTLTLIDEFRMVLGGQPTPCFFTTEFVKNSFLPCRSSTITRSCEARPMG